MEDTLSGTCYRCRRQYDIAEDELTPLGYLCVSCFDDTICTMTDRAFAAEN